MRTDFQLIHLPEPQLVFGHGQALEDPRHGLNVFGPFESRPSFSVSYGIIGTADGIRRFRDWLVKLQGPIAEFKKGRGRPPFPGFQAAFGIAWDVDPLAVITFEEEALLKKVNIDDVNKRVHETVGFIFSRIVRHTKNEDNTPTLWMVVVPDIVHKNCRPKSRVPAQVRVETERRMDKHQARAAGDGGFLFESMNKEAEPFLYEPDFHHQLKGRLLKERILTQIVLESTVAHHEFLKSNGKPKRDYSKMLSQIAWNLSSAVYYKVAGRPWKLSGVRPGVCYIGLVFKKDEKSATANDACCAAQMFLDSGDGVVFKGHNGPWYSPDTKQCHLSKTAAQSLLMQAIQSYRDSYDDQPPSEIFIHGRTHFDDDEWEGFSKAAGDKTKVIGVRIVDGNRLRLYRLDSGQPLMRGLAWLQDDRRAMLLTNGYLPSLGTYPGMEVPIPLEVEITRGDADIRQVLQDILGLTKLNYNSCRFADGYPVTLKFADAVGDVLLSGPATGLPPLPFKHYI